MTALSDQTDTVAFLTQLAGHAPVETHISYVFVGQDTVWKLKKAVRLPFLDFTRIEDRRRFCERELALNAPSSPGLYRDVAPITRQADGALTLGGTGEAVDWVLRMEVCAPLEDFLASPASGGSLTPSLLDEMADAVAAAHAASPPIADLVPDMAAIAEGNVRSARAASLPADTVAAWREAVLSALTSRASWRTARAGAGFIRRCHGDLHLGNLCFWRGKLVPFDALEFDETLARIDVAYDLAFLLMDLERRFGRPAASRVLNRYVARTGDAGLLAGLPVFLSLRAMIRAHVQARSGHAEQVTAYLNAAMRYLAPRPPIVLAIGGLPGTGKSTLARALAPFLGVAPGALIARADEIRKRQHGAAPEQRLSARAYTPAMSTAVFEELTRQATVAAQAGHAVIADATFMDLQHRAMIQHAAAGAGAPFIGVWLQAPAAVLEQRVAARQGDASDATVAVLRSMRAHDPGAGDWHAVDATDGGKALALAKALVQSHIVF